MKRRCVTLHHSNWDRSRLKKLISLMRGKRVLVLGDVGVDRYTFGNVERISPEAPVPIVAVQEERLKLGLAANVADNVKALGGEPMLCGMIGRDRIAADFSKLLRGLRISVKHLVQDASRKTTLKERIVSDGQQLLRIDYESLHALTPALEKRVESQVMSALRQCDAFVVEDYAKGLLSTSLLRKVFARAHLLKKPALVDPNSRSKISNYRGADVLTPNKKEAEELSGVKIVDAKSLIQAGEAILKATQARQVVITRGKDGMAIVAREDAEVVLIPTYAREVYDVSGAGDTVIAVLALALSAGATVVEASILGNLAAGDDVGKRGTATESTDEILKAMEFFGVGR